MIAKSSQGTVTKTGVFLLDEAGRQEEIARMLSGAEVTPEARAQADRLLEGLRVPTDITEAEAANELMQLARQIAKHDRLYHAEDAPEITDQEYDALVRRNGELEAAFPHLVREDSPSRKVGHTATTSPLSKVTHEVRMMSLDNAFNAEEVEDWVARVQRFLSLSDGDQWRYGPNKIDGLSCSLRYEQAGARGDARRRAGGRGCDAQWPALHADIPQQLDGDAPEVFEIRGEVYMARADFEALNTRLMDDARAAAEEKGEEFDPAKVRQFANPRNAAAGSPAAEGRRGHRAAPAQVLGAWLGCSLRCAGRNAGRSGPCDRALGRPRLAVVRAVRRCRRNPRALRSHRRRAPRPAL